MRPINRTLKIRCAVILALVVSLGGESTDQKSDYYYAEKQV